MIIKDIEKKVKKFERIFNEVFILCDQFFSVKSSHRIQNIIHVISIDVFESIEGMLLLSVTLDSTFLETYENNIFFSDTFV